VGAVGAVTAREPTTRTEHQRLTIRAHDRRSFAQLRSLTDFSGPDIQSALGPRVPRRRSLCGALHETEPKPMTLLRRSNHSPGGWLLALVALVLSALPSGSVRAQNTASGPTVPAVPSASPNSSTGAGAPGQSPSAENPPSTSGAPPVAGGPAPGASSDGAGGYTVRLRSLEKNVNELKEQIFRTKARLNLLKETVLGGTLGASRAVIRHKNEMGSSYRLIKAVYALDGVQIFAKADDSGRLAGMPEFDIYNGAIQPGSHTLGVTLVYQGNGFGVFSYLTGYKMTVHSSHTFVAGEAKATAINVVGYEKGNITTNLQDRPAVDFRVSIMAVAPPGATTPTASAATKK
jgi:hypothetical protein